MIDLCRGHFYHCDEGIIDADFSIVEVYEAMTSYNPFWLRSAFKIRDFFCAIFGLRSIGGFSTKKQSKNIISGSKLDFFDVEKISKDELLLSASDRHLVVFVSLLLNPISDKSRKISVTTVVYVHNVLGEIYMLPVRFVHGIIVKRMLQKVMK